MALSYPGLIPSNVNRDAKYSVVTRPAGGMEIRLIYRVSARERELLTTDRHDALVTMVNQVKLEETDQPGGAFYINEYFDVLVPTQPGGCFYAGTYEKLLEFDFEGGIISPRPPAGLQPGDPWPGPHVGIRYTLTAGGNDIKYWQQVRPGRSQEHRLSDHVGQPAAAQLANRLRDVKGWQGAVSTSTRSVSSLRPSTTATAMSPMCISGPLKTIPGSRHRTCREPDAYREYPNLVRKA